MVGQRLEPGRLLLEPCSSRPTPTPLPVCATESLPCSLDAIQMLPRSLLDATSWAGGQRNINSRARASNSRPSCNHFLVTNHFFFLTISANEARCPCHIHVSLLLSCLHTRCPHLRSSPCVSLSFKSSCTHESH